MEILDKVKDLVKPQYDTLKCWVHSWPHIQYVVEKAKELAELEGVDSTACMIAAYCHDLGRIEEEIRKQRGELPLPHALFSIEPTIKVLQTVGISGTDFSEILEAVTIHSYKIYEGNNNVVRILQDADKMSGMCLWSIVCIIRDAEDKDYINPKEIIKNCRDKIKMREMGNLALSQIGKKLSKKVIEKLDWILEYVDKDMFHTETAKEFVQEDYEYLKKCKEYLIKKFNIQQH